MALQVKKAESFGDLVVSKAPQQRLTVSKAAPHQPLRVAQHPSSQWRIGGVTGAKPNPLAVVRQRTDPMQNPLKWFGDTAVEFATGVADMLNPASAFTSLSRGIAETMAWDSEASRNARESQSLLEQQNIELLKKAAEKIRDPKTSKEERARWQNFVRSQAHLAATNQFQDATLANDEVIEATDPVQGALNTVGVAAGGFEGKAAVDAAADIYTALNRGGVVDEAMNYGIRQQLIPDTSIPVTKEGGGNIPIPVRVNKSIPVRYEASNDVLDNRLAKEYDILYNRYSQAVKEADQYPEGIKEPILAQLDEIFERQKNELFASRDAGIIPQRIDVKDAPKTKAPKVAKPKPEAKQKAPKAVAVEVDEIPATAHGKSPGLFQRSVRSVEGVLKKSGTGGRMINEGVQRSRDYSEKKIGSLMVDLKKAGFDDVDDDTFARVWDAVEAGSAKGLSGDERRLAGALVRTMSRIHKSAKDEAGMNIGDRGSTYLPHWFKNEDEDMVALFRREFSSRNSNLERKRESARTDYERSKESIVRYIQNASERIGQSKEFGQSDELLQQMFDVARREGYDVRQLARYAKTALGRNDYDSTGHKISGGIRKVEAVTSLQRAAAANIGQQTNTVTKTGIKNWAKAVYKYATDPNARDAAERAGVFGDHVLGRLQKQYAGIGQDYAGGSKQIRFIKKHVLVPGMQAVEKWNRANAVLAGRYFAEEMAKKATRGNKKALRLMEDLVPGWKPGMELTDDMLTDAGRSVVKNTQFKTDPVDLPNWADSAVGKLIFQFRSFGYKQTQFLAREVYGEALKGNFAPFIRFHGLGIPIGYGIYEGRNMILSGQIFDDEKRKEAWEKSLAARAFEGFSQIGGGGLPLSEGMNMANNYKYADDDDKVWDTITGAGGPAITDIRRAADSASKSLQGDHRDSAYFIAQQLPVVGPFVAQQVKKAMKGNTTDPSTMSAKELDKYKKTTFAKFMDGMSDKDKDLMEAVNDEDYARLGIKSGKFTQDQIDEMQAKYNRELFAKGLPVKYIKGITDEEFDTFSDEMKGLVMEASMVGIKKFAESDTLDKTADAVMKKAMEDAWPEVGELKFNNQMAIDYLKAQRDYVKAGEEADQSKQFDIVKGFWGKAVKQQYRQEVRSIYSNSLADIRRLMAGITVNGVKYQVSRQDIDQAIELDNRLLAAGLRDTPKFSNKTRAEFGYGDAPTTKVSGVGYAGPKGRSSSGGRRRSGSRGGSGGGGSGATGNPYRYTLKRGSRSRLSGAGKASSSGGKASVKLAGTGGAGTIARPKVSRTKNKV